MRPWVSIAAVALLLSCEGGKTDTSSRLDGGDSPWDGQDADPSTLDSGAEGGDSATGCLVGCGGHGACEDVECRCDDGYTGPTCEECVDGWHRSNDGTSCTQSLCDPNTCPASAACSEDTGSCCASTACALGSTQCSDGQLRRCEDDGLGCGRWGAQRPCGGDCASVTRCESPPPEWQTVAPTDPSDALRLKAVVAGTDRDAFTVGLTDGEVAGQAAEAGRRLIVSRHHPDAPRRWTRVWGDDVDEVAGGIALAANGDVLVTGSDGRNPFLGRLTSEGGVAWGGDSWIAPFGGGIRYGEGWAVTEGPDGSVFVAGATFLDAAGDPALNENAFLTKLTAGGVELWTVRWGSEDWDFGLGVAVAGSAVYVVGRTSGQMGSAVPAGSEDCFVSKLSADAAAPPEWTFQFGGGGWDEATAVTTDAAGDVYVTGAVAGLDSSSADEFQDVGSQGAGAFLAKFTPTGTPLWFESWGGRLGGAFGVSVDSEGVVHTGGGVSYSFDGQADIDSHSAFITRWVQTPQRQRQGTRIVGTAEDDWISGYARAADGTSYLVGYGTGSIDGGASTAVERGLLVRIAGE